MALYLGLGDRPSSAQHAKPAASAQPAPALITTLPTARAWLVTLTDRPSAGGAIDDRRIYLPIAAPALLALDRSSGATLWRVDVETAYPPIVSNGSVLIATGTALQEIDAASGSLGRRTAIGAAPSGPMTLSGDLVIVPTADGALRAIRRADQTVLWSRPLGSRSVTRPAVSGGTAIAALEDARLVAVNVSDGRVVWSEQLAGQLTEPTATSGRVFVGSSARALYALDARTGAFEWRWSTGAAVVGAVANTEAVYVVALDNSLRALNRGGGNQRWQRVTTGRPSAGPQLLGRLVIVPAVRPALAAYDVGAGAPAGEFAFDDDLQDALVAGAPLVAPPPDDAHGVTIVIITRDGRALGLREAPKPPAPDPSAADVLGDKSSR